MKLYTTLLNTTAEHESDIEPKKDTPHPTLSGELQDVYCELSRENWLHNIDI